MCLQSVLFWDLAYVVAAWACDVSVRPRDSAVCTCGPSRLCRVCDLASPSGCCLNNHLVSVISNNARGVNIICRRYEYIDPQQLPYPHSEITSTVVHHMHRRIEIDPSTHHWLSTPLSISVYLSLSMSLSLSHTHTLHIQRRIHAPLHLVRGLEHLVTRHTLRIERM